MVNLFFDGLFGCYDNNYKMFLYQVDGQMVSYDVFFKCVS